MKRMQQTHIDWGNSCRCRLSGWLREKLLLICADMSFAGYTPLWKKGDLKRRRNLLWLLLPAVFLTACESKDETAYVYVAEQLPVPGGQNNDKSFRARGGYLYYVQDNMVYRVSAKELSQEKAVLPAEEEVFNGSAAGVNICAYTLDGEGCGYFALTEHLWTTDEIQSSVLVKQQADGTEGYRLDLDGMNIIGASLAVDGSGRAFLLTEDSLCIADAEGKLIANIPGSKLGAEFHGASSRLFEGEDDSVYYVPYASAVNIVYEVTGDDTAFRKGNLLMKRIEVPSVNSQCYSAQQGLLLAGTDGMLYRYRRTKSEWETLLSYGDSNLQMQPYQMLQFSEEWLAAYYYDFFDKSGSRELYFLTKTDSALLPERDETELVLVTSSLSEELEQFIAEYNRTSGYHITVKYYQGEERITKLNTQMVSSDPPDLIDLEDETALKFAERKLLEDLSPYLETSTVLDREDFLENLLEGYTLYGRLVCIPDAFDVSTAVGRTAQAGTQAGWTTKELQAFLASQPEKQIFLNPTFTSLVAFFAEDILAHYIDWDSGECCFDEEEFHSLAKWMKERANGFGSGYPYYFFDSWDNNFNVIPEDQLIWPYCPIDQFDGLIYYEQRFGEEITAIGYPTSDGRPYHTGSGVNTVAITANSRNKEAAWQFLEAFLSREKEDTDTKFPSRRELLMKAAEDAATPDYELDHNGEIALYQAGEHKGEPVMKAKFRFRIGGEETLCYYLTREQVDAVLKVIEETDFTPRHGGLQYNIIGILLEELGPYIEDRRSLEESTRILQNRVRNLVQENLL